MLGAAFRLALREIRNHKRFSLFFSLNLALGFAGFVALEIAGFGAHRVMALSTEPPHTPTSSMEIR